MLTFIYSLIEILVVLLLIYLFKRFVNPVRSVEATVVGKMDESTETTKNSRRLFSSEDKVASSGHVYYWISFELKNGKIREFSVNDNEYAEIDVMDKGILTYKGKNFLAFDKEWMHEENAVKGARI